MGVAHESHASRKSHSYHRLRCTFFEDEDDYKTDVGVPPSFWILAPIDEQAPVGYTPPTEMSAIALLLKNNRAWSENMTSGRPDYFRQLAKQQSPLFLWIGCADSRVPANEVVGLMPGELFVHRNVANLIYPADLNCLSVVEYAVDVLRVQHIIICGHYGCGGVKAAMSNQSHGLIDNWLSKIKDTYAHHHADLESIVDPEQKLDRLCELNVVDQVRTLTRTTIVQDAWHRGQTLSIHGWIYGLKDGLVNDLGVRVDRLDQVPEQFRFVRNG